LDVIYNIKTFKQSLTIFPCRHQRSFFPLQVQHAIVAQNNRISQFSSGFVQHFFHPRYVHRLRFVDSQMFYLCGTHFQAAQVTGAFVQECKIHQSEVTSVNLVARYSFVVVQEISAAVYYQLVFVHFYASRMMRRVAVNQIYL